MNYRHAYHAGNFADCMKHALLVWMLRALRRKERPFFVLDSHAGPGPVALLEGPAGRTGEWQAGIARLRDEPPAALADYVGLAGDAAFYPGSAALIAALLRDGDRLACCELHPEDCASLRAAFAGDRRVAVHGRDGWEALRGLLPPALPRGLVLIDPPFEAADEHRRLAEGLREAAGRFPGGTIAGWYPVKHRAPVRVLQQAVVASGLRDVVAAELFVHEPVTADRLNGAGLIVVRPPWRFEDEAEAILEALRGRLAAPGGFAVSRLADE